jgi:arginyl-tRNA synthetase
MRFAIDELHAFAKQSFGVSFSPQDWAMVPANASGDFALPCFQMAKALGKKPPEAAAELGKAFANAKFEYLTKAVAQGPYLNVFINFERCFERMQSEIAKKSWGSNSSGAGQKLVVEFSSPNIAKEMGFHHIRTTAIGHALARVAENAGFSVTRINYLGDWGTTHGKLLVALERFGDRKRLEAEGVSYMLELYVKFNQEEKTDPSLSDLAKAAFRELEEGRAEYKRDWKLFRELSIKEFEAVYKRLGIHFDLFDGESFYEGQKDAVVAEIEQKIGTRVSEGAVVCDLPGQKIPALLKKDDGASLYLTRDIAAIESRFSRYAFNEHWYVVAVQQKLHFEQLFAILKLLGKSYADRLVHIPFGMLAFGAKTMKTREGNVIFLNDVLDQAQAKAREIIQEKNPELKKLEEVSEQIGIGAILFSDLSQNRVKDVHFKWEEALNFDGDTAPFIQYTHARATSLLQKAAERLGKCGKATASPELLESAQVQELLREWAFFEIFLKRAIDDKDPSQVAITSLRVAKAFNRLYHHHRFLDEQDEARFAFLMALAQGTQWILRRGLYLLGISAPEEM